MNYREFLEVDTVNEMPAGSMKHFDEGMIAFPHECLPISKNHSGAGYNLSAPFPAVDMTTQKKISGPDEAKLDRISPAVFAYGLQKLSGSLLGVSV